MLFLQQKLQPREPIMKTLKKLHFTLIEMMVTTAK